jgi:hypothetical protein
VDFKRDAIRPILIAPIPNPCGGGNRHHGGKPSRNETPSTGIFDFFSDTFSSQPQSNEFKSFPKSIGISAVVNLPDSPF